MRKPGAFAAYRYRDDLFPTTTFDAVRDLVGIREVAAIPSIQAPTLDLAAYDQLIPARRTQPTHA